jgi:uncharacterized membrane protein YdjX (TVP38/TMEM64 family)
LLKEAVHWIAQAGVWAPVLYIGFYVVACVVLIPAAVLTLAGGAAFGVFWGAVYVSIGATLGATAAFLVGRYLARDWVVNRLGNNSVFAALDRATENDGWKIVFLTRLAPVFPFFLMNYAYSVTRVPLKHYFMATGIGMIPGTLLYVYIGSLVTASTEEATSSKWLWRGFVLFTALVAVAYLGRIARKVLRERVPPGSEPGRPSQK